MIIDLTPVRDGTGPARLLNMVPERSKVVFKTCLTARPKGMAWHHRDGGNGQVLGACQVFCVRGCAVRSWLSGWSGVPAVGGSGVVDELAGDDDDVGQGDESLDDPGATLGADGELVEASVVPGVGAFHDVMCHGFWQCQ